MTAERTVDIATAHEMFATVVGEYVWFVRISEDRVLRMEFGDPYLNIREPRLGRQPSTEAVERTLRCRIATPTGTSSMFVEHGLWRVESHGLDCSRSDDELGGAERILRCLSGQKLSEIQIKRHDKILILLFDLGGRLEIDGDVNSEDGNQWILFFKQGRILAHDTIRGLLVED